MRQLMPLPAEILPGPPRTIERRPNAIAGRARKRLRAAVERLPPLGMVFRFDVQVPAAKYPSLGDSYDYRLRFGDEVRVAADTEWGALAALATVAGLALEDSIAVSEVRDRASFPWRGLMIDTARHFISLEALERTLDAMWFYKLNVLHLHLTDDQGFRFRSNAYPELASDDCYSVRQLRQLVVFAADRGIRVVPELDMPGHSTSWLLAHPEWGTAKADLPNTRFGVYRTSIDPSKPAVLKAVDTLCTEIADVFADDFVHFGGDEVADIGRGRQAEFHRHVVKRLTALGKRPICWDECLHRRLPKDAVVQAWRGMRARDAALDAGYDCVVSSPYYLDLFFPADYHYAFEPAGDLVAADTRMRQTPRLRHASRGMAWMSGFAQFPKLRPLKKRGRVLGGEACIWAELVTDEVLDTRVWSRMPVIAERFWRGAAGAAGAVGDSESDDLLDRLAHSRRALAALGTVAEDRAAIDEHPQLAALIEMLEPVKWYWRLLGADGYAKRVDGGGVVDQRPYNVRTPLNRIVDRIAPESLASRRAEAEVKAGRSMQEWLAPWREQREALQGHPLFEELCAASDALAAIADILAGDLDAKPSDIAKLAGPFGEYLLPIAYAVAERKSRDRILQYVGSAR